MQSIYDFLGMKVVDREIKPTQQRFMVPLQGLPKGVYIINLKNKKGITSKSKDHQNTLMRIIPIPFF
jgi:hypothetical protein